MTAREVIARLATLAARGGTADDEALRSAVARLEGSACAAPRRTLPVRIAVAIGASGKWDAYGEGRYDDHTLCEEALGQIMEAHQACYIVTADVPVPEVREVAGEIEPGA